MNGYVKIRKPSNNNIFENDEFPSRLRNAIQLNKTKAYESSTYEERSAAEFNVMCFQLLLSSFYFFKSRNETAERLFSAYGLTNQDCQLNNNMTMQDMVNTMTDLFGDLIIEE